MALLLTFLGGLNWGKVGLIVLVILLALVPAIYYRGQVSALNVQVKTLQESLTETTKEAALYKASLELLHAQAEEQKRALEVVYEAAKTRNQKLAADLEKLRKMPPPADCKGSMNWLREKAQELQREP